MQSKIWIRRILEASLLVSSDSCSAGSCSTTICQSQNCEHSGEPASCWLLLWQAIRLGHRMRPLYCIAISAHPFLHLSDKLPKPYVVLSQCKYSFSAMCVCEKYHNNWGDKCYVHVQTFCATLHCKNAAVSSYEL